MRFGAVCGAALAVLALALAGCGGSGTESTGSTAGSTDPGTVLGRSAEPDAVVVRVGEHAITQATVAHALAGVVKFEGLQQTAPVPPHFRACVEHLQATASGPRSSARAALEKQCEQQYRKLLEQALDPLISWQWVLGAAAEAGFSASEAELRAQLRREEAGTPRAQVLAELATHGETLAEFALEAKVNLLGEKIRHMIRAKANRVTSADVDAYYRAHKSQFGIPQRRAMYIARTATKAQALAVKREIVSGQSFASVVKSLPLAQPIFSKDGFVAEYEPDLYTEPPLNDAILKAPLNVLSKPVKIFLGWYVFEVKRVIPAVQEPLAKARAAIRAQLPYERYKSALRAYVHAMRARWRARTHCRTGYVVPKCANGKPAKEDAYTLG